MSKQERALKSLLESLQSLEEGVKNFKKTLEHDQLTVTQYTVMSAYQNLLSQMGALSWYCSAYATEQALSEERMDQDLGWLG